MNERLPADLGQIRAFLDRLSRRERAGIALEVGGRTLLVAFAACVWLIAVAWFGGSRSAGAAGLVVGLGAGAFWAWAAPLLGRWRPAGDALRQARFAEAEAPDLRGRLVALVERDARGPGPESEALVALAARRAVAALPVAAVGRIHRLARGAALVGAGAAACMLALPMSLLAGGPLGVLRWWAAGLEAGTAIAALNLSGAEERAQVGDLVVRYVYPEYTGLEPRVVENSTGDVQGPPGTLVEVRARSSDPLDAAGLVAYDQRYEARVTEGRQVEGSFSIGSEKGAYHLITWRGETSRRSRDFQIAPVEDLAPEVMIEGPEDRLELAVDEPLQFAWRARDDHGVARVEIQINEKAVGAPLFRATERVAEAFDQVVLTPGDLGLSPGQTVRLSVAATDNDSFGGAKTGVSRTIELVVLGARGLAERDDRRLEALVGLMLTALGDHLEDPLAATIEAGGRCVTCPRASEVARWGEAVAGRYEPLQEIVDRDWDRLDPNGLEAIVLGEAVRTGGDLIRYTQVAFEPGSSSTASRESLEDVKSKRVVAIQALEDGILTLDRALRASALREVVELAERMEDIGRDLEEMMAKDADALAMLARLEQLEAMVAELAMAAQKLDEGGLKEFINARQNELQDLLGEIRKAIAEGRMEDARRMMQRLADQLGQLAEGVRDTMERTQQEGDDAAERAEALTEELKRLEEEQRALQAEVSELRDKEDAENSEREAEAWEAVDREIAELLQSLEAWTDELIDADRPFNEVQRAENAQDAARRMQDAATGRDYRATRGALVASEVGVDAMYRGNQATRFARRDVEGPGEEELQAIYGHLRRIEELLDRMGQSQGSPAAQQKAQELQARQQELEQRLEQARREGQEVGQQLGVPPRGMDERLGEAGERMGEASEDLGQGRPMPAEGSQGAAADRIREAREALERAMEQSSQMGQGTGQESGEDEGGNRPSARPPNIEIPTGEEFRTPEQYRRALLEGMQGEVPEEFQALKKRYFEELVRQ